MNIPLGPLDTEPVSLDGRPTHAERVTALRHTLRGVALGIWDHRLIEWVADRDDALTILSWLERVRLAERDIVVQLIQVVIAAAREEWARAPEAWRGPHQQEIEEAYRSGLQRAVVVIRDITEFRVASDPPEPDGGRPTP